MSLSKINDDTYFQIWGFMVNRLGLKGVELNIYAIIYGFSQDSGSEFTGSLQYLCDFTGATKPTIIKALKTLSEKGLIIRREENINNIRFLRYKIVNPIKNIGGKEILLPVKNLYGGSKEILPGVVKKFNWGSKETLPNNIRDNINDNIEDINNIPTSTKTIKHKYGEHKNVLLTDEEYTKLKERFPNDYDEKIDTLSEGLALKGYKYKSHYLAVIKWAKNETSKAAKISVNNKPDYYDTKQYEDLSY